MAMKRIVAHLFWQMCDKNIITIQRQWQIMRKYSEYIDLHKLNTHQQHLEQRRLESWSQEDHWQEQVSDCNHLDEPSDSDQL